MMFEDSLIWFVSGGLLFTTVILIVACICGCHKSIPKSSAGATLSSATRSLPDLPVETPRGSDAIATAVWYGGDTNSELYATVEENKNGIKGDSSKYVNNTMSPSSGTTASKSECVYACVNKENPYDKLQQEHPYAKVGVHNTTNQYPGSQRSEKASSLTGSIELDVIDRAPDQDIAAASVIAGDEAASINIPYMTPPVGPIEHPLNVQPRQGHYSGDSHDSSKGYTSISVREPLSRIMSSVRNGGISSDPHYAFVSDDSDEMYAAIIDPSNNVYTSGSETYAQIPSAINMPVALTGQAYKASTSHINGPEQTHSRQDSSSSAVSSNSPKPEKRPANSPLPKPPEYLDEMYAKVMKKRNDSPEQTSPIVTSLYDEGIYDRLVEPKKTSDVDPNYEELRPTSHGYARIKKIDKPSEPDYASLTRTMTVEYVENDPNYESLKVDLNEINHNSIYSEVNKR
ncbi:uncharacterized protein LOC113556455 isoform X3 [Rhopalosiphum maidis]|uniref:uncharacterized protein LOC113556455 isoform X3 n=1 Tax=Rhopalosiphum maidis TaxID=43146 RepID=UPI000F000C33|nr:uncharacterized protein LOC113556455 isoform X3 [Rhopalosiphum maidis]